MIRTNKPSKRTQQYRRRFTTAVTAYIKSLGAQPATFYDWVLATPAGPLRISVYGNWVATRFDDVEKGLRFSTGCGSGACNRHSGKWNFHFNDGTSLCDVLSILRFYIDQLLAWEPAQSADNAATT